MAYYFYGDPSLPWNRERILRICMEPRDSGNSVIVFDWEERLDANKDRNFKRIAEVSAQVMGIPSELSEEHPIVGFALPFDTVARLTSLFPDDSSEIWFEIGNPLLQLVPWEHLLHNFPYDDERRSFRRIPAIPMKPALRRENPQIAFCLNLTSSQWHYIGRTARLAEAFRAPKADVFTNNGTGPSDAMHSGLADGRKFPSPDSELTHPVSNPWLRWVSDQLGSAPIDCVAFLCDAQFTANQVGLALYGNPDDAEDQPFLVNIDEIEVFLMMTGAWAVIFIPVDESSAAACRLLASQLSERRAGPVYVLPRFSWSPAAYLRIVRDLLHDHLSWKSRYVACFNDVSQRDYPHDDPPLHALTLADEGLVELASSGELDRWVVAAQRILERHVTSLLQRHDDFERRSERADYPPIGSDSLDLDRMKESARVMAMRNIVGTIKQYVRRRG